MRARSARRAARAAARRRSASSTLGAIPRTAITVADARAGRVRRLADPARPRAAVDPGHRPGGPARAPVETSLRNVAYALLSGADGWMFDGEDALGQVVTMSLDNQRNLTLALARTPLFLDVAEKVAAEMNAWAPSFFGRPIVDDWREQLDFTTPLFRARGLHLDDRHVRGPTAPASRRRSSTPRSTWSTTTRPCAGRGGRSSSTCRRSRPPRRRRCGTTSSRRSSSTSACRRDDQGLRAGRAARGLLPADGDPRRARPPLRRLQHRALGLHQQRRGRDGLGPGVPEPQHRRRSP